MYCGSCLHDNALARAMRDQGVDCLLQPVYTPIRVDGVSAASEQIFFGGIHIYLLQQWPWLRRIPRPFRGLLDWPPLIRLATRRAQAADAKTLGQLTVSMLKGTHGNQREEVGRLVDWLADEIRPDAIVLSNLLIGGALPEIRRRMPNARILVILQGDDIFLDHLQEEYRKTCIELCSQLVAAVDQFVFHSQFYADKMGALFAVPPDKRVVTPLSIDTAPFSAVADAPASSSSESSDETPHGFRLGYLARIAPEKGLHRLIDAFIELAQDSRHDHVTLHAAGWLGDANRDYLKDQQKKLDSAGLSRRFTYHGSPDLPGKVEFLRTLDLLSVPTDYADPKGLFVLEAHAAGVPVVQPNHGAFGELLNATGGGILTVPHDTTSLVTSLSRLISDEEQRHELANAGRSRVLANHNIQVAAEHLRSLMFD